jgi:hypothetical protein
MITQSTHESIPLQQATGPIGFSIWGETNGKLIGPGGANGLLAADAEFAVQYNTGVCLEDILRRKWS